MTNEEAREAIKFGHCDDIYYQKEYEEAVNMAIKALEQTRWIPVSERLPMNGDACCDDDVLVSCEDGSVKIGFCMGYDELGNREWCISADKYAEVAAWMPLPQPYKAESKCEDYIPYQHIQHIEAPFDIMQGTFDAEKGILTIEPPYKTEEQQRKKGKWIRITNGAMREKYICSECGRQIEEDGIEGLIAIKYPYCHCGAKMEVDK